MAFPQVQFLIFWFSLRLGILITIEFVNEDRVVCPRCRQHIGLGPAGLVNLRDRHLTSKRCADAARAQDAGPKKSQSSLMGYLRPKAKPIAPTVSDPLLVKGAASTAITTALLPGPIPSAGPSVIVDPLWQPRDQASMTILLYLMGILLCLMILPLRLLICGKRSLMESCIVHSVRILSLCPLFH